MIETADKMDHRGEIRCFGLCTKCNVVYKAHISDFPADGVHKCRECGAEITIKSLDHKTMF